MPSFPTLAHGAATMTPLIQREVRPVRVLSFASGKEQRFSVAAARRAFTLTYTGISYADVQAIENFFNSQQGAAQQSWDLTIGAQTWNYLHFASDELRITETEPTRYDVSVTVQQWRPN